MKKPSLIDPDLTPDEYLAVLLAPARQSENRDWTMERNARANSERYVKMKREMKNKSNAEE